MANINQIFLLGNLTRDPEIRYTNEGMAITEMNIAINKRWKDPDGEENINTDFFNITAWNHLAENCANNLKKGDRIFAGGHINLRTWENKDGKKFNIISISADVVGLSLEFAKKPDNGNVKEDIKKNIKKADGTVKKDKFSNTGEEPDYIVEIEN